MSHSADAAGEPADELVTVLDDNETPIATATRRQVRAGNLLHAATAVLVRRADGCVYVHRRTTTKDIFPGLHDCWAGGVLAAGEAADDGARRELAEELGITGVELTALTVARYSDQAVRCIYHAYCAQWDGEIVHQAAEVAWGDWWSPQQLRARLRDPAFDFVPDGRWLLAVTQVLVE